MTQLSTGKAPVQMMTFKFWSNESEAKKLPGTTRKRTRWCPRPRASIQGSTPMPPPPASPPGSRPVHSTLNPSKTAILGLAWDHNQAVLSRESLIRINQAVPSRESLITSPTENKSLFQTQRSRKSLEWLSNIMVTDLDLSNQLLSFPCFAMQNHKLRTIGFVSTSIRVKMSSILSTITNVMTRSEKITKFDVHSALRIGQLKL